MDAFERLTTSLGRLPSVGRRSAERMALALVRRPDDLLRELLAALTQAAQEVCCCSRCGAVTETSRDPCRLCTDPRREDGVLCVVEDPGDIILMERSGGYRGRYHALMGRLSPMKGMGAGELRVRALAERVAEEGIEEVVLALSTDVEGDSTASFIAEVLGKQDVKVTRLAFGLPAGSGIGYSDPVTLARAFKGRQRA